jgi:copper(I)-binding protein
MKISLAGAAIYLIANVSAFGQVTASNAWVRAPAPGQDSAAGYVALTSPTADALTGVDATGFGMAMLHVSKTQNGISSMADLDSIRLPAGQTVTLKPGGFHIMLMDFKAPPKVGSTVRLTFHFMHAKDVSVAAPVKPVTARGP